jgi:hypothetical protein
MNVGSEASASYKKLSRLRNIVLYFSELQYASKNYKCTVSGQNLNFLRYFTKFEKLAQTNGCL